MTKSLKKYHRKYWQKHRDKFREYNRNWYYKKGKEWHAEKMRKYRATLKGYYKHLIHTRKYKKIGVSFSFEEFERWYNSQERECFYCAIPEKTMVELGLPWRYKVQKRFSLDRMDPFEGYSLDNICLCCRVCNEVKSNILSWIEMKEIGQKYIKPRWQKLFRS